MLFMISLSYQHQLVSVRGHSDVVMSVQGSSRIVLF